MYKVDICDIPLALFYVVRKENLFGCDKALLLYDVIWLQDYYNVFQSNCRPTTKHSTFHILDKYLQISNIYT